MTTENPQENAPQIEPAPEDADVIEEAVGVFKTHDSLQAAAEELMEQGFMQQELSVLADDETVREKLGYTYADISEAEDDPKAPRTFPLQQEVLNVARGSIIGVPFYFSAAIGAVVAAALDASLPMTLTLALLFGAAGGLMGFWGAEALRRRRQQYLEAQEKKGGFALWVHLNTPEQAEKAKSIFSKYKAKDVHVHKIPTYG